MIQLDAQCVWLSVFAGLMVALTVCVFILAIIYVVIRARDGPNKSLWLKIFRLLYLFGGPGTFGLAVSYPLYLKHVYHATSIFSDTPTELPRCFLAYSSSGGITLALGLWWLNRQASRLHL
jgi:hypothetical protein